MATSRPPRDLTGKEYPTATATHTSNQALSPTPGFSCLRVSGIGKPPTPRLRKSKTLGAAPTAPGMTPHINSQTVRIYV